MRKYAILTVLVIIVAAAACSRRSKAPPKTADYFFAPEAGTHFVYKLEPRSSHVVAITKVAREEGGNIRIELQEKIFNLPSLAGEIEFRTEYVIDAAGDAVRQSMKHMGGSEEVIVLRGPIKGGEPWEVRRSVAPVEEGEVSRPDGIGVQSCSIAEKQKLEVLGKKRDCIRVVCEDQGDGGKTRRTFCKGLGYTGQEYMADEKWTPVETLIRMRELPQGEPM